MLSVRVQISIRVVGWCAVLMLSGRSLEAHELGAAAGGTAVEILPTSTEGATPSVSTDVRTTGRGRWTFVAVTQGVLPVPDEAKPLVKGAHGTLVVDRERDVVYWGLEQVGWVAFSELLTRSRVVQGDPALQRGNLHGADLLSRAGRASLIAVADNVEGELYLSDTSFQQVQKVAWPARAPYVDAKQYHPTDVAFVSGEELYVTDGYGAAHFMAMDVNPLAYRGEILGGKSVSQTPHGITWDSEVGSLVIAARPEGQLKRWSTDASAFIQVLGLPAGSTVCDIEIRGDHALAPCLNGPDNSPGPIYLVNLRERTLVSTLRPKADLGFEQAQHIHDATWYEANGELYVLFTNWNPGGIGAMKLVR